MKRIKSLVPEKKAAINIIHISMNNKRLTTVLRILTEINLYKIRESFNDLYDMIIFMEATNLLPVS